MHEDEDDSKRHRKRRRRKRKNLFDLPGVRKIILTELTQKIVECVVGEHVSSENPWKFVRKELVQDNLELHEESSEFLPLKLEILQFPRTDILLGYIADETQDKDDEFYICVTEEATDTVQKIIEKLRQEQEDRLYYQLYKDIHSWQSMGTEAELDETLLRNNRALLQVEVETKYPIFPSKVQFRLLRAENKRDGYMELKCSPDENLQCVQMKRIDNAIQIAPSLRHSEAQTICTYPRNTTTQYSYRIDEAEETKLFQEVQQSLVLYAETEIEDLTDLIKVNGTINLYADDFESLIQNNDLIGELYNYSEFTQSLSEYLSFMDVNLCKGKMISDVYWHRMWSGTIAIAYCDASSNIFFTGVQKDDDEVYKAVHGVNLVLIWSFLDALKPKLILESPREIHTISFCKFDENVLIGGCKNGQIVLWDIRNKLQRVEEKEILTTAQQKYRSFLHSLMGWMKQTHDIAIVRPAAVSDLRYSHKSVITGISWVEPHYEFTRTGNLSKMEPRIAPNGEIVPKYSMQFLTSSLDGNILIWDLQDKPTLQAGGYRPKKLKRLKERPSALKMDESPFKALHLNLKPRYRISVARKDNKTKLLALTKCSTSFCWLNYEELNTNGEENGAKKRFDIKERVFYRPILDAMREIQPIIKLGTAEGDYIEIEWEGQDFDSGEIVNSEQGKHRFNAKYHDGPVTAIHTSPANNVSFTVGGKIFALWRKDFPDRPILWRRNRQFYTRGELNLFQPFKIILHTVNGQVHRWILPINSKSPVFTQVMSNSVLTAGGLQPIAKEKIVYGVGDEQGAFRLFYIKQSIHGYPDTISRSMNAFIDREINRKKLFLVWQDEFNKRHESYIIRKKEEEEQKAKEDAEIEAAKKEEPKVLEKIVKKGPQPGKFMEWILEQRQIKEEARIKAMIINKKQLDTKELEKRRKPLQKLDEENERKKRKQKERLKQGETIFKNTVASLFPDVVKEKPCAPPNPYIGGNFEETKENCYEEFSAMSEEMDDFIVLHPLQYDFSFKNLLVGSKSKSRSNFHLHAHSMRYATEKGGRNKQLGDDSLGGIIKKEAEAEEEEEDENNQEEEKTDQNDALEEII